MRWTGNGFELGPQILRLPEDGGAAASSPDAGVGTSPDTASPASPSSPAGGTVVSGEVPDDGGAVDEGFQSLESQGAFAAFASDDLDEIIMPPAGTDPKAGSEKTDAKPVAAGEKKDEAKPDPAASPQPQPQPQPSADKTGAPDLSSPAGVLQGLNDPATAAALIDWLAQKVYALDEGTKAALSTDAVGAIPGIMARVHVEAAKNTLSLLHNLVPKLVMDVVGTTTARKEKGQAALNAFFKANPDLNPEKHGDLVDQFAKIYRGMNPKATRDEAIKFVASSVRAHLGLQAPVANGHGNGNGVRRPFTPARPGARQISEIPLKDSNPFAGMGEDHEE